MRRKRVLFSLLSVLLCAVLLTTGALAWMRKQQTTDQIYAVLSDFEVEGILSFGGTPQDVVYEDNKILFPVGLTDGSPNYIGDMKFAVKYTGASPAYLRVRVLEQWVDRSSDEILSGGYLDYHITGAVNLANPDDTSPTIPAAGYAKEGSLLAEDGGEWVDNRVKDYCYYYSVPVQPKNLNVTKASDASISGVGDGAIVITLIDQTAKGADVGSLLSGINTATTNLSMVIEVEAVQPNRFREFFGVDAIPQPTQ